MGLNIKNAEVERLAGEVAGMAHESKTEAIRRALLERRDRLQARAENRADGRNLKDYLQQVVWPLVPPSELGRTLSREDEDRILGYGPEGF
jgi:antitoxin VapB